MRGEGAPDGGAADEKTGGVEGSRDPFRWLGAPESDRSLDGQFRREVEKLARELLDVDGRALAPEAEDEASASPPLAGAGGPTSLDIRDGTPFLILMAARALEHHWATGAAGATDAGTTDRGTLLDDLVLVEVARRRDPTPQEMSRALRVPPTTVSAILASHVRNGWVTRHRNPRDARSRALRSTAAGRSRAEGVVARLGDRDDGLLDRLTPAERDGLRRLLGAAIGVLGAS